MNNTALTTTASDGKNLSTTDEQAPPTPAQKRAFDRIGITGKKFKRLTAKAEAGRYLDKLGLFEMGAANMVIDVENIDASISECDKILAETGDVELKVRLIEIKTKLQDQRIKLTEMHLKAKPPSKQAEQQPGLNVMPATGQQILIAVQDAKRLESERGSG